MASLISLEVSDGNDGGVENGDFTYWNATAGAIAVVSDAARQGTYSIGAQLGSTSLKYAMHVVTASNIVYGRVYISLEDASLVDGSSLGTVFSLGYNANAIISCEIRRSGADYQYQINSADGVLYSWTTVPSTTEWFAVELQHNKNTAYNAWVNGTQVVTDGASTANAKVNRCYVSADPNTGDSGAIYFDALQADNSTYIGLLPELGGVRPLNAILFGSNF